ncbi:invasion associated locus B family protein [Epibacterium ulvae]|uniref:invasion associated locus B family protein n=1 Tax=Epibacterium ulvae TaxID=1156985 RepID=UPI0024930793|nr:invasion associated locus B family protein [Epibacterium ulvae]
MTSKFVRFVACLSMACVTSTASLAQQATSENRVGVNADWNVFQGDSPKECWGVSQPKETVNTRDGRVVAVRRSDIQLFVFYRPEVGKEGQVTFTGGYPFAPGSTVSMVIGDSNFDMITDGEWAWPAPGDDGNIISAMKRGASAVLTARSARGTQTKDTFSLLGFTAAVEDADKRCNN